MAYDRLKDLMTSSELTGVAILPEESQNLTTTCSAKQFFYLMSRLASPLTLQAHLTSDRIKFSDGHDEHAHLFIGFELNIENVPPQYKDSLASTFSWVPLALAKKIANLDKREIRGARGAFVSSISEPSLNKNDGSLCLKCHVVFSTAVFFNNYRVTLGFPQTPEDEFNQAQFLEKEASSLMAGIIEGNPLKIGIRILEKD